jgi:Flp pilus assembly protein TadG
MARSLRIFWRDRRANFAVMFALSAPILVVFIGMGIDFLVGLSFKSRWDTAADAAAIAAVKAAEAYVTANAHNESAAALISGAKAAGNAEGKQIFNVNAGACETAGTVTPLVDTENPSGTTFTATVSYTGTSPSHFGGSVGISNLAVSGSAVATATMTTYINYYIAVDISQSMGIGSTTTDQTNLYNLIQAMGYTEEGETGCVFGCHVAMDGHPKSNEQVAHEASPPITLRIDAAITAIQDVIAQAKQAAGAAANIDIALYTMQLNPFSTGSKLVEVSALSSNYTALGSAAGSIDLGPNSSTGLGDSDMADALTQLTAIVPANGNGFSASSPLNYALVITDGMMDIPCADWNGHCSAAMPSSYCAGLQANASVGVVYTTYPPIYANNNPADGYEINYNSIVAPYASSIQPNLQACASNANLFYEATDGPALVTALHSLFQSTLAAANRLTQ